MTVSLHKSNNSTAAAQAAAMLAGCKSDKDSAGNRAQSGQRAFGRGNRARLPGLLLAAALGLAACVETTSTTAPSGPVGPGASAADAATTVRLFNEVCVANMPNLDQMRADLTAGPYRLDTRSGIHYHNTLDLSFKVRNESGVPVCSIVAGLERNADAFAAAVLAIRTPAGVLVKAGEATRLADRLYVSAIAIAR
jgi:hypothetical protein